MTLYDWLPWQHSTYQRDAVASSGQVISDIVSIAWSGNVASLSQEAITFTVLVDDGYEGVITNTAVISHADLRQEITVTAVAYITDDPVLFISKSTDLAEARLDEELEYTIQVRNAGQRATGLVITDTIPENTTYVLNSASGNGQLVDGQVQWTLPELDAESAGHIFIPCGC